MSNHHYLYSLPVSMHPKSLSISDFSYLLPPERVAQQPLPQRDQSRLLIYKSGILTETRFSELATQLPADSTLVFNDTKVIHARILFKNENGANIEVFLLEPVTPHRDMQLAMFQHGSCTWKCLVGNVKKWREQTLSKVVSIANQDGLLEVRQSGKAGDDFLIHFSWKPPGFSFAKILEAAGYVPLPPYIKREAADADESRYQTVYAFQDGSVAAPTAGLHFSENVFASLKAKHIRPLFVTLHVGAGTFKPVKSDNMEGHEMHAEPFVVQKETLQQLLLAKDRPVIAAGTTSCRTLESLYWLGKKIAAGETDLQVAQWDPYEVTTSQVPLQQALQAVLDFMQSRKLNQLTAETKLIIAPGYDFKIVEGLITNFHLPNSTLLLLIAAFIGDDWRKVYTYALTHQFRFLSYGDASLLWKKGCPVKSPGNNL